MIIQKERRYSMQTYEMNLNEIKKAIKKLQIPKEYGFKFDIESVLTHDFSLIMSIRQDAGKTTQALLLGLVLNYLYGTTTEYMRSDNEQIRQAKIETMYDVIIQYKYIERLFDKFNTIIYKRNEKKFYLAHIDEKGVIDLEAEKPLCAVHSLEEWKNLKSSYVNPNGDYLIFDEFMDLMSISVRTAQLWRDQGLISYSQISGKIYYKLSDVHQFIRESFTASMPKVKANGRQIVPINDI